jgi:Domain of unknown function (DUF397)
MHVHMPVTLQLQVAAREEASQRPSRAGPDLVLNEHCPEVNMHVENGVPADQLKGVRWRKSVVSNPNGSCVEVAGLPGGEIAVRNSRDPSGPALVYTQAEIAAFLQGAKNGEFDNLIALRYRALKHSGPALRGRVRLGTGRTSWCYRGDPSTAE